MHIWIPLTDEAGGHVLLRSDLACPSNRPRVTQGGNAAGIEIGISR